MTKFEIQDAIEDEIKAFYKKNKKILFKEVGSSIASKVERLSPTYLAEVEKIKAKYQPLVEEAQKAETQKAESQKVEAQKAEAQKANKSLSDLSIKDIQNIQQEIEYSYNGYYSESFKIAKSLGYTGLKCSNNQLIEAIKKLSIFETIEDLKLKASAVNAIKETYTIGEK